MKRQSKKKAYDRKQCGTHIPGACLAAALSLLGYELTVHRQGLVSLPGRVLAVFDEEVNLQKILKKCC